MCGFVGFLALSEESAGQTLGIALERAVRQPPAQSFTRITA
jgi:hypothetical protein